MRLLRNIVLTLIAVGMVLAAATQPDAFFRQLEIAVAVGAFALAWLVPG